MANIATVSISLVANSAQFLKSLGKAERGTKKFAKNAVRSLKRVAVAGAVAGAALVGAVLRATAKQDLALSQLRQGVISTGGVAQRSAEQLQKIAESLQLVSNFGDDAIVTMQAILLTFTQIRGDNFDRTTVAVIDLATRMGTDLPSAALQLAKALNDPVANLGALSRAGIQFSLEQKAVIKTMVEANNIAGAQVVILTELENQFGGSAKAARDTLGGAFIALKNVMGDLLEQDDGIPAIRDKVEALTILLSDPKTKQAFDDFFGALVDGATAAVKAVTGLTGFIREAREFLSGVSDTLIGQIRIEIAEKVEEIETLQNEIEALNRGKTTFGGGFFFPTGGRTGTTEEIAAIEAQVTSAITAVTLLQFRLDSLLRPSEAPVDETDTATGTAPVLGIVEALETEALGAQEIIAGMIGDFDTFFKERQAFADQFATRATMQEQEIADARVQAAFDAENAIRAAKETTQNLILGLAITLGRKSKLLAIAAIALEKGLAISRFLINNQVAAELAFASQLIPGFPPSLAAAAAAKAAVLSQGPIGAAIIAAQGVIQIAGLSGGGGAAGFGAPENTLFTGGVAGADADSLAGFEDRSRFQINIFGDLIGVDDFARTKMIDAIRDAIDENDMIIIGPDSAQAEELLGDLGGDG